MGFVLVDFFSCVTERESQENHRATGSNINKLGKCAGRTFSVWNDVKATGQQVFQLRLRHILSHQQRRAGALRAVEGFRVTHGTPQKAGASVPPWTALRVRGTVLSTRCVPSRAHNKHGSWTLRHLNARHKGPLPAHAENLGGWRAPRRPRETIPPSVAPW